jgi:hypothetical protein
MLVRIAFSLLGRALRSKNYTRILQELLERPHLTMTQISKKTGISYRSCQNAITALEAAELVSREEGIYSVPEQLVDDEGLLLNLRDARLDEAFRSRGCRITALELYNNGPTLSMRDLSKRVAIDHKRTATNVQILRSLGIVDDELKLGRSVIHREDELSEIPLLERREAIQYFRDVFAQMAPPDFAEALILHGPIANGTALATDPAKIICIFQDPLTSRSKELVRDLADAMIQAAGTATRQYGLAFSLAACPVHVFWDHLWGWKGKPHSRITDALLGITVWGKRPKRDLAAYSRYTMDQLLLSEAKKQEWIGKHYLHQSDGEFLLTERAIRAFQKLKGDVKTYVLHMENKDVEIITIERRGMSQV